MTVTVEEAQARLPELINQLAAGEEVVITRDEQPVAKLIAQQPPARKPRRPGALKGILVVHAEDDEHLKDFEDYMP